jgi:hypothetical protein
MKRFWVVLLLLGLIAAFSTSAMAVDVKFSGEYSVTGMYLDRTSLQENINPSTAFYYQRLRLRTEFVVAPGLSLITRADIMERAWGASRSNPASVPDVPMALPLGSNIGMSGGTRAENENIAFDWLYISYLSPIGHFLVGYVDYGVWGTTFGDTSWIAPRIMYTVAKGGLTLRMAYVKGGEWDYGSYPTAPYMGADRDYDIYYPIVATYAFKQGRVGLLTQYQVGRSTRVAGFKTEVAGLAPYAMLTFGPVSLQAEILYAFGKFANFEIAAPFDIKVDNWAGWIDATADLGMFYVGGSLAYVAGDDPGTPDKLEGGLFNGGYNWNPCLLMWNYDRTYWAGTIGGYNSTSNSSAFSNGYFAQLRGGVRPIDKLDIMVSVSYAKADKIGNNIDREYGYEVDLTATYKITNNLSYMLGGGYWFVGDWYKGISEANKVDDNFMVINKLTLTF